VLKRPVHLAGTQKSIRKWQFVNVSVNEFDVHGIAAAGARGFEQSQARIHTDCQAPWCHRFGKTQYIKTKPAAKIRNDVSGLRMNCSKYRIFVFLKRR
jgi:hypothetical protein